MLLGTCWAFFRIQDGRRRHPGYGQFSPFGLNDLVGHVKTVFRGFPLWRIHFWSYFLDKSLLNHISTWFRVNLVQKNHNFCNFFRYFHVFFHWQIIMFPSYDINQYLLLFSKCYTRFTPKIIKFQPKLLVLWRFYYSLGRKNTNRMLVYSTFRKTYWILNMGAYPKQGQRYKANNTIKVPSLKGFREWGVPF